ncbi:hypothetical protein HPB48_012914 [Haemaphysalis longicornis]|uniref:RING-type domain-containing protein n=1 Tax=Haemaphysalis longicornis TaxID=44386 RepID=A0A9J6GV20_HAELO|nr:hypothetical protein HPB48_012914 [Haemaphysalis longicornis]
MAPGGRQYTLVGFSEELDRRPLNFVEALPPVKVCSACGLVPNGIAFLPCGHSFCKPCFKQCERRGPITCPLDGDTCSEEEVAWINHPARSILTKQVRCWNYTNGCNTVTAAADISRHFHHECAHHSARCPKCAAQILASDLCAHLEVCCDTSRIPSAAAAQRGTIVPQQEEAPSITCSAVSNGLQRILNATSTAVSSIQAEPTEISSTEKIDPMARAPRHGETGEKNLETRTIQKSLDQVSTEMAKLKDHLDEFIQNVYANQQTFHNEFVETNEASKQSISGKFHSRIDHGDLVAQFDEFRETLAHGQRETKALIDRLSTAIQSKYDRIIELFCNACENQETPTQLTQEGAEAHTHSLAKDASMIAWATGSPEEDRQNALALLPSIVPAATAHTFIVENYEGLKQCAQLRRFPAPTEKAEATSGTIPRGFRRNGTNSMTLEVSDEDMDTLAFQPAPQERNERRSTLGRGKKPAPRITGPKQDSLT